ncbi:MAG: DMT family transporter [Planctomycetota bacterium]|nr:DMT family transporter [Planctomycetota bacterium]MDA1114696.1 DMT family transporter [Planctomycetota bacterium]
MQANLILLLAAMIWGAGFAAQHAAMEGMGPLTFTAIRFLLGWAVLQPIVRRRKPSSNPIAPSSKPVWILGLVLFAGALFQQYGLLFTTAAKAGFLTGLYVVFVPLLGLLLKHKLKRNTWLGTGFAALGLYFLSVTDSFSLAPGDGLILIGAVIWAVHVLLLGNLAAKRDPVRLASQQFLVVGVLASLAAVLFETQTPSTWLDVWPWVLYSGVFAVAVAFTLQAVGQAKASPAHCAILLSFEAVFAALAGIALLGESLSLREIGGGSLMFLGIVVSQLGGSKDPEAHDLAPEIHPPAG